MYSQADSYNLRKREILRLEDTVAGDVHHTVGQGRSEEDSDGGDDDEVAELSGLGTYRGVEKVYSVVAHADNNVRNGEAEKENDDSYIQKLHNCV